jgi:hypothetical protein
MKYFSDEIDDTAIPVGKIGNQYGGLAILKVDGKCYWGIENYNGTLWEEIPASLYDALLAFKESQPSA